MILISVDRRIKGTPEVKSWANIPVPALPAVGNHLSHMAELLIALGPFRWLFVSDNES